MLEKSIKQLEDLCNKDLIVKPEALQALGLMYIARALDRIITIAEKASAEPVSGKTTP